MSESAAAEALCIASIIFERGQWTQHAAARDSAGEPVAPDSPAARSWSLPAGVERCCRAVASRRRISSSRLIATAIGALQKILDEETPEQWNNKPDRTAEDVAWLCSAATYRLYPPYQPWAWKNGIEALRRTADLLERTAWSEEHLAASDPGRPVPPISPNACIYSLKGAFIRVAYHLGRYLWPALLIHFMERQLCRSAKVRSIHKWCRAPGRQLSEITDLLRSTATRLETETLLHP